MRPRRLHWLERLLRVDKHAHGVAFHCAIKFGGIWLIPKLAEGIFGVHHAHRKDFGATEAKKKFNKQRTAEYLAPYDNQYLVTAVKVFKDMGMPAQMDLIVLSAEMCAGNPLHLLTTAAHEVGHHAENPAQGLNTFELKERWAEDYAKAFLKTYFGPELSGRIYAAFKVVDDSCHLPGVSARAARLARSNNADKALVGRKILAYLKRHKKPVRTGVRRVATAGTVVDLEERIRELERRL